MHRLSALIRRETFGAPYTPFRPLAVFAESPAWHIFAVGTSRLQTAPGAYSRLLSQGHFPCWLQNPEPEGDCFTSDSDTWHSAARRGEGARARLSIYHASMQASKKETEREQRTFGLKPFWLKPCTLLRNPGCTWRGARDHASQHFAAMV